MLNNFCHDAIPIACVFFTIKNATVDRICIHFVCVLWLTFLMYTVTADKRKAVPLQAWTGLEGSMKLRFPDIKAFGT